MIHQTSISSVSRGDCYGYGYGKSEKGEESGDGGGR